MVHEDFGHVRHIIVAIIILINKFPYKIRMLFLNHLAFIVESLINGRGINLFPGQLFGYDADHHRP